MRTGSPEPGPRAPGKAAGAEDIAYAIDGLVQRAVTVDMRDVPAETVEYAARVIADTIGVITAGAGRPEMVSLTDQVAGSGAGGDKPAGSAEILGAGGRRADPATASWLNGTAATFLELDEGYRPTGHPAAQIVPAALAAAQARQTSGSALLAGFLAGYEIAARLFEAFRLPEPVHPHGHLAGLAAAAAVARIWETDPGPPVQIAAIQPLLTTWPSCYAGATARNTWAGHANRVGILANVLARAGFTGSLDGLACVLADILADARPLDEPVDPSNLRLHRNYIKLHSACALTHSALDATEAALRVLRRRSERRVTRASVTVAGVARKVDRPAERNSLSTRFSVQYAVAARILCGGTGPEAFEWRPAVAALAEHVDVEWDPALDSDWPASMPARVRLETEAEEAEATVGNPRGHFSVPVSRGEMRQKFIDLVAPGPGPEGKTAEEVYDGLLRLGELADCSSLVLPIARPEP